MLPLLSGGKAADPQSNHARMEIDFSRQREEVPDIHGRHNLVILEGMTKYVRVGSSCQTEMGDVSSKDSNLRRPAYKARRQILVEKKVQAASRRNLSFEGRPGDGFIRLNTAAKAISSSLSDG